MDGNPAVNHHPRDLRPLLAVCILQGDEGTRWRRDRGRSGLLFAILLGIVNVFLLPSEVGNLYAKEGRERPISGLTGFWVLLPIIGGIIWVVKTQGRLNDYWEAHGATAA